MKQIEQQELPLQVDCRCPGETGIYVYDQKQCSSCISRICLIICPAGLFKPIGNTVVPDHEERLCLECGACRMVCENVDFRFPEDGTGILHKFG